MYQSMRALTALIHKVFVNMLVTSAGSIAVTDAASAIATG
jgi:hypothetical protein